MQKSSAGKFHSALPEIRATVGFPASLRLDARELDHLGPFLDFLGDELAKIGGRTREHCTSQIGEARLHGGIGESGINFLVELLDNIYGRGLGYYDPVPASRLVAW